MKRICWGITFCATLALCINIACAQVSPPDANAKDNSKMASGIDITVSPRFWYVYEIAASGKPQGPVVQQGNALTIPMTGLAFSAKHAALPDTAFVLSAIYGRGRLEVSP